MAIKKIKVSNFKSFNELDVELGNFNVVIGANASGKSNFLEIFRFLKDITNHGLSNAISMQGGVEYFRNASIGSSKDFFIQVVYQPDTRKWSVPIDIKSQNNRKRSIARDFYETDYHFSIKFIEDGTDFQVSEDKLIRKLVFCEAEKLQEGINESDLNLGEMIFAIVDGKLTYQFINKAGPLRGDNIFQFSDSLSVWDPVVLSPKMLFMEDSFFDIIDPFDRLFHHLSIYDFDPKLSQKGISITGKIDLEDDASNLAIVLNRILQDKEQRRMFFNLIKDLLPFVDDLRIEKFADKSLLFSLQEKYAQEHYIPASFLSEGTINLIALIIALYFDKRPLTIIEEPERFVHPFLISKVVNMIEDAAKQKQIIVTTHNPETVRYVSLEDILLVSRDKEGFSTISKPSKSEQVKNFLQNEIGIAELFAQDLLGV